MSDRSHRQADRAASTAVREGDRRGEVRRRVSTSPTSPTAVIVLEHHRPGRIVGDRHARGAERCPGVIHVFTHENAPSLGLVRPQLPRRRSRRAARRSGRSRTTEIHFNRPAGRAGRRRHVSSWRGTPRRSSSVDYDAETARDRPGGATCGATRRTSRRQQAAAEAARRRRRRPSPRAAVQVDAEYRMPIEHHNPMELFATTAVWDGRHSSPSTTRPRASRTSASYLCDALRLQPRTTSASSRRSSAGPSARACGRTTRPSSRRWRPASSSGPVKVVLTRQQMFTASGYRPTTQPARRARGRRRRQLPAVIHEAMAETSRYEDYSEEVVELVGPALRVRRTSRLEHKVVRLDLRTPSRHAGARARSAACSRSNARWTSSPSRWRSTRSSCG